MIVKKHIIFVLVLLVIATAGLAQGNPKTGVPVGPIGDEVYNCRSYIYYDIGKYDIKPAYYRVLDSVVTYLKNNPSVRLKVVSFANEKKVESQNLSLAQKRADHVMEYIVNKGVVMIYVTAKGCGTREKAANAVADLKNTDDRLSRHTEFQFVIYGDKVSGKLATMDEDEVEHEPVRKRATGRKQK